MFADAGHIRQAYRRASLTFISFSLARRAFLPGPGWGCSASASQLPARSEMACWVNATDWFSAALSWAIWPVQQDSWFYPRSLSRFFSTFCARQRYICWLLDSIFVPSMYSHIQTHIAFYRQEEAPSWVKIWLISCFTRLRIVMKSGSQPGKPDIMDVAKKQLLNLAGINVVHVGVDNHLEYHLRW